MILSTKLKNAIERKVKWEFKAPMIYSLKNIIINGEKKGCDGFIYNPENGVTVYVNTECLRLLPEEYLYRHCKNMRDFKGSVNHFAHSLGELVCGICDLLKDTKMQR